LNLQMNLMQQGIDVRQRTDNLEAYDSFLRAIVYGWELTKDSDAKAVHLLQKAVQLDPGYADAYATLGVMNFLDWVWQWSKDPEALDHSFELERKAIALDDSQPVAHAMLGRLLPYKGQYDQAIAECQRSLAIAPDLAYDYVWIAETLTLAGKPAEAIGIAEKAMRLDPKRSDFYLSQLGLAYYLMGRDKEAIPFYQQHLRAFPNNVGARLGLAATYAELGRQAAAQNEAAAVMRLSPQFSVEALKPTLPLKDPAQLGRIVSDLHKAGLK
jgi:adenylate cyclase